MKNKAFTLDPGANTWKKDASRVEAREGVELTIVDVTNLGAPAHRIWP
jgi:hypothetical protein